MNNTLTLEIEVTPELVDHAPFNNAEHCPTAKAIGYALTARGISYNKILVNPDCILFMSGSERWKAVTKGDNEVTLAFLENWESARDNGERVGIYKVDLTFECKN